MIRRVQQLIFPRQWLLFLCCSTMLYCTTAHAERFLLEGILATVNDDVILLSSFRNQQLSALRDMRAQKIDPANIPDLKSKLLEDMIIQKLQLSFAKRQNISIPDLTLNRRIQEIAQRNKLTLLEMQKALQKNGADWRIYRENIREQMVLQTLRQNILQSRIKISEADVDELLARRALLENINEYELAQILIPFDKEQTESKQLEQVTRLAQQIKQQKLSFNDVSARYSKADNALRGGQIGWRDSTELPDSFLRAIQRIKRNQITSPIRSSLGFHILQLRDIRAKKPILLTRYKIQQIHLLPSSYSHEEATAKLTRLALQLRKKPDEFAQLAQQHTQGNPIKNSQGEWLIEGRFDTELENHIAQAKDNAISGVIRTQQGWYLFRRLAAERFDGTSLVSRERARRFLQNQSAQVEYTIFLRNLRGNAAVTINQEVFDTL